MTHNSLSNHLSRPHLSVLLFILQKPINGISQIQLLYVLYFKWFRVVLLVVCCIWGAWSLLSLALKPMKLSNSGPSRFDVANLKFSGTTMCLSACLCWSSTPNIPSSTHPTRSKLSHSALVYRSPPTIHPTDVDVNSKLVCRGLDVLTRPMVFHSPPTRCRHESGSLLRRTLMHT